MKNTKNWKELVLIAYQLVKLLFFYPSKIFELMQLIITKPRLLGELIHLTERRKWIESANFSTIIDVGGFIGSFSYAIHTLLPKAKIYAFEPNPETYPKLIQNLKNIQEFQAFNTALGDTNGYVDFFANEFSASSSLLPTEDLLIKNYPYTVNTNKTQVKISKLDDFSTSMILVSPTLLKIDVQGFEEKVLAGGLETLKKVDVIILEISYQSLYKGQSTFDKVYKLLTGLGFEYKGSFEAAFSPIDGSILQSDIIFSRTKG
jgi:FkbM family methyltransferase